MILERAIFAIKPGEGKAFEAAYAEARTLIEAAKGCHRAEMHPGIDDPDNYLLLVWWDSVEDHMNGFRESKPFQQWRTLLGPYFARPPAMEHYKESL
jgi:heme-degrading monooxygenase HmoA